MEGGNEEGREKGRAEEGKTWTGEMNEMKEKGDVQWMKTRVKQRHPGGGGGGGCETPVEASLF